MWFQNIGEKKGRQFFFSFGKRPYRKKERIWGERDRSPPTPGRREKEEVGGGIIGGEGMVAANNPKQYLNLICSNCWNMDDLDKSRC